MKYEAIVRAFFAQQWAILPEKLADMRAFLRSKANGADIAADDIAAIVAAKRSENGTQMIGRVAVLPVMGVISQRVGMLDEASGGVSAERIGAEVDRLAADPAVKSIVMAFDSPGGSVAGIPETAVKIRAAREQKKVVAFLDPMAASAAYWWASQASEIVVTPSGQAGSIGVITAHDDISAMMAEAGIKTTIVASSPFKAELWPEVPLSDEARADLQSKVDQYHSMFVADIAKGRGISKATVEKDFGQGRMMLAGDAVKAGMADRIGTLPEVLKRLGADIAPTTSAQRAMARARAVEISSICH